MTSFVMRLSIAGATLLVAGATSFAVAQAPRAGRGGSPMYDAKTETTIVGTVERVDTIDAPAARGRGGLGGTHLVVKTETESVEVHLGPSAYLSEQKIVVAKGDTLEILGSRMTIDEKPVVLARQIKKGRDTWTFRDASGRPMWSGRRW